MVLIYILKVYCTNSSSILLRKICSIHYLHFSFENHVTCQIFLHCFLFLCFSWQILTIHRIPGKEEEVLIFLVFHFHLLTNIHLVHRDFYHFCLIDLFVITRLIADETCSPQRFAFFWIFIDEIKSKLLTLTFQSDITRIWVHIKLSPFYRANTLTAILILQFILLIAIIYSRGQNKKKIVETVLYSVFINIPPKLDDFWGEY